MNYAKPIAIATLSAAIGLLVAAILTPTWGKEKVATIGGTVFLTGLGLYHLQTKQTKQGKVQTISYSEGEEI